MFTNTSDDGAKPKAHYKHAQKILNTGGVTDRISLNWLSSQWFTPGINKFPKNAPFYTREKYLCKNLRVKRGEGICSKGAFFGNLLIPGVNH